ncbi:MAG: aspartate carbamoyltransferase catalytic subunit [Candidatus Limnocylindrus sp.]
MVTQAAQVEERSRRHLLDVADLDWRSLQQLLASAEEMQRLLDSGAGGSDALRGVGVTTVFYEPSTRTRISFEAAAAALGARVTTFNVATSSVGKGESLVYKVRTREAQRTQVIVLRHERAGAPWLAARYFGGSIVNAGDGWHAHPTQALLDLSVLSRHLGDRDGSLTGRRIAIVGDLLHSRVVRSNLHTLTAAGATVMLTGPSSLTTGFAEHAASFRDRPGSVQLVATIDEALQNADAVMALRIQRERLTPGELDTLEAYRAAWGLTEARLAAQAPRALVLHPGPMNEGVEIDPDVADGPRSLVLEQVSAGIPMRMAVLQQVVSEARA